MSTHLICLTIDTDPDGLNTFDPDRRSLVWDGLHFAMAEFHRALDFPLTWYVRADGQLEHAYGNARYLFDTHTDFWHEAIQRGDELGWHPHLYTVPNDDSQPTIITDSTLAVSELKRIHAQLEDLPFALPSFRMGEAWHTRETLNLIESFGYAIDSTAIPDRDDSASGHPRNWAGAPNQPYYPAQNDIRRAGEKRPLLEVPMNSWYFQASYDNQPKLRYMNPCVHPELWDQALDHWEQTVLKNYAEKPQYFLWNLILHPAESMPQNHHDLLYAHSLSTMKRNIDTFLAKIETIRDDFSLDTLSKSAKNMAL